MKSSVEHALRIEEILGVTLSVSRLNKIAKAIYRAQSEAHRKGAVEALSDKPEGFVLSEKQLDLLWFRSARSCGNFGATGKRIRELTNK
jgi:hypothetical protein